MGVTRYSVGNMGRLSSSGFYLSRKVVGFMVLLLGALLLAVGILGTFYVRCSQTSPLSSKSGTVTRTPANCPVAYKLQVGEEQKASTTHSPVTRHSTPQPSWSRDYSRSLTGGPRDHQRLSTSGSLDDPILFTSEPRTSSSLSTSKPWTHSNLFSSRPRGLFTSKPRDHRTQSTPQPQSQPQPTSEPWKHPRLPSDVVPLHYDLELWVYLRPENIEESSKFFSGRLNITVKCVSPTTRVLVHSLGLDYEDTAVLGPLSEGPGAHKKQRPVDQMAVNNTWMYPEMAVNNTWMYPEMEYLVIELRETLKSGHHYMLQFDFSGSVNQNHKNGLFRTLYSDQKNTKLCFQEHYKVQDGQSWSNKLSQNVTLSVAVIASQLEPTFARAIYPCFDEPVMKATFNVTIVHHPTFVALSNMPAIATSKREDANGFNWTVTSFETTPLMSTYITAFAVCDYHYVKGMERGKEVRIWARKDAIAKGEADFSLSISGPIFSKLEDLFNVSYPLPKIDLIGFPTFNTQAMENWGLITFDDLLLVQTKDDLPERKIMIMSIVAHEIAHQWFGNLVTMKWWNDVWLNEGFASYFEYYMMKEFNPQIFKFQNEFFYHSFMSFILKQDHVMIDRSISTKVVNYTKTSDINVLFDEYIYKKGGCIVRMFSNCLGEDLFIRGLQSYLKTFAFSNAEQDDLWNHFQMVLNNQNEVLLPASVKSIMDKWTHQSGCPIITLDVSTGKVNQQPFFLAKDKDQITPFHNNTWTVPINWMKSGVVQPLVWLDNNSKVFPEMQLSDSEHDWVILNFNTTGYYMANYDQLGWKKICLMLEKDPKVISVSDRMKLFDDAFTLSWHGYNEIEMALDLTKYLAKEGEALVWNRVFLNLLHPDLFVMNNHNAYLLLKKYLLKKLIPMWHIYSNKIRENTIQDDEITILSLKKIFEGACWLGLEDCLQLSREIFSKWMNYSEPIKNSNLIKYEIMCFGIAMGSDKEWDFLLSIYEKSQLEEEKENLLHSMSCSKDPRVLYRSMEYALDENSVISESSLMLNLVAETVIGRLVTKEFLINNWQAVEKRFGKEALISLANTIAAPISTDSELQEFQQFSRTILGETDSVTLLNTIKEHMKVNQQNNKSIAKIINWLKKNLDD